MAIGVIDPLQAYAAAYGPQVTPQGWVGDLVGGLGGQLLPGPWGGIAQGIGNLLPFSTGPSPFPYASPYGGQMGGQVAPQGFFGNLLGGLGGQFLPGPWGGIAQGVGSLLPFSTGPSAGPYGGVNPMAADPTTGQPLGVISAPTSANPEARAYLDFLREASGHMVDRLRDYLNTNRPQNPELADVVPLATRSAELYGTRDYLRALAQAYEAYRAIAQLRARAPNIPPL